MRIFTIIILVFRVGIILSQQPPICGNNPAMTSFCSEACIICDIDGFTGRNNSTVKGQAPPGFCTTQVHHMQWIGFIAGTTNLTLEVKVTNCVRNQGLEIGLYEGINCQNFKQVSECDTDVRPGQTRVFRNTVPLVVGQYYYFVMDGSANDICDWSIKVTEGSTKVAPLVFAPEIIIPEKVCQDFNVEINTPGVIGATFYQWSIDGVPKTIGKSFSHTFEKSGIYKVCLDASNVCDQAPKACKDVAVLTTARSSFSQEVCFGECFTFLNNTYCDSGLYEARLAAANGCDSIISFTLNIKDKVTAFSQIHICDGDTILIGDSKLYSQGIHEVKIENQEGCSVFLTVDVTLVVCDIQSNVVVSPVLCNAENTGAIKFKIVAGTAPFTYRGNKLENSSINFSGVINNTNQWITVENLDEGNYTIWIQDNYGNTNVINQFVPQPPKLVAKAVASSYHDYKISCFGKNDGFIKWIPEGGVPTYQFIHDFSDLNVDSIGSLSAGNYRSVIRDSNGCFSEIIVEINEPDPIEVEFFSKDPDCSGANSGRFVINEIKGGVPPYQKLFNNQSLGLGQEVFGLGEGRYHLEIIDDNGCSITKEDTLIAAVIPEVFLPFDSVIVELGDSTQLIAECTTPNIQISWTYSNDLSCNNCLITNVLPLDDNRYTITVVSSDGCEAKATVNVIVVKNRSFVISNVFSPNGDGINDRIRYLAGKDVLKLDYLRIYDRWGNLVYSIEDLQASGITELDWEGDYNGQLLGNDVFSWVSNVLYKDQISIIYKGSMTILR